jgi:hypothetical protein
MPTIEIPDVGIVEIYIPDVPEPFSHHYITVTEPPEIDVPGCTYQHRDIKNTGNRNLLLEDPNGVFTTCDFPFPGFVPLDYTPQNIIITEQAPVDNEADSSTGKQATEIPEAKKEEVIIPPCPSSKDQRVGDFRNEKRLERVIGHKRGDDGIECITVYENVPFIDQYVPTPSMAVSTFFVASIAATTPLLLNAIKPLTKQLIKRLTKPKKDKVE